MSQTDFLKQIELEHNYLCIYKENMEQTRLYKNKPKKL